MLEPKGRMRLIGGRTICFVLVMLLGGMTWCPSGAAWAGTSSWLDWLFALFSADDIPQRPALTEQDRTAIDKTRASQLDREMQTVERHLMAERLKSSAELAPR